MTSNIPTLLCSKFQGALYIEFDSVNVGSSHTRLFKLQNPNKNKSVTVSVDRVPDKKGFSVTLGDDFSQSIEIEANGYVFAHVLWCPLFNMAIRESAYLKVDNLPVLQITLHGIAGARNNNTVIFLIYLN